MPFVSIRLKILGGFAALLMGVFLVSLAIVDRSQTARMEREIEAQLQTTRGVLNSLLLRREQQLASALGLLGNDFAFKQAIASTRDAHTIESAALNLKTRVGADLIWVCDEEGKLWADTSRRRRAGTQVAGLAPLKAALQGQPSSALLILDSSAFQLAAVPLLAPDLIGVLVAGFRVDDAMAVELKSLTRSDVSFASGGRLVASTLEGPARSQLEAWLPGLAPAELRKLGQGAQRQIVLPAALSPDLTVVLQRSWHEALGPLRRLQRILLLIGIGGCSLTLLLGFGIAHGITRPAKQLVLATRRVVDGDYDVRVEIGSKDEIGELSQAFNQMVEGLREKEQIRSVLQKAVSREIADELLSRGPVNLGGEERVISVLFSDIRGFTSFSETLAPAELVAQLNAYFSKMSHAIDAQRGVIDKYVGDAIMALFGAPLSHGDDAAQALRAALGMQKALAQLNAERAKQGLDPWHIGIGINTGLAVAGAIGSEERWSYTVIGDSVNLASRLESLTKRYGVEILLSQATRDAAQGQARFLLRSIDLVKVKGKDEAVEIFELLGEESAAPAWLEASEAGVAAFRQARFAQAKEAFEAVLRLKPGDILSLDYLERLQPLLGAVPNGWTPERVMTEK